MTELRGNDPTFTPDFMKIINEKIIAMKRAAAGLRVENDKLRKALEFYADKANYKVTTGVRQRPVNEWGDVEAERYSTFVVVEDGGQIARKALGGGE